jgi:hypothetical protein
MRPKEKDRNSLRQVTTVFVRNCVYLTVRKFGGSRMTPQIRQRMNRLESAGLGIADRRTLRAQSAGPL